MKSYPAYLVASLLAVGSAVAQQMPVDTSLADAAAKRFPQPVRVGDLLHRDVLQPVESQTVLGHVKSVVRAADGTIDVVVDYGGLLGFGARPVAIPVDAMVVVGQSMEVVGFKPAQLNRFPTFAPAGNTALSPGDTIKVGLARPSH